MNTPNAMYGYAELKSGDTWANVRVTLPTKIALERSARANKWQAEGDEFTMQAFMSWHAARLAGLHDLEWDAFVKEAIDAGVLNKLLEDDEDDEVPTAPGAGTE